MIVYIFSPSTMAFTKVVLLVIVGDMSILKRWYSFVKNRYRKRFLASIWVIVDKYEGLTCKNGRLFYTCRY